MGNRLRLQFKGFGVAHGTSKNQDDTMLAPAGRVAPSVTLSRKRHFERNLIWPPRRGNCCSGVLTGVSLHRLLDGSQQHQFMTYSIGEVTHGSSEDFRNCYSAFDIRPNVRQIRITGLFTPLTH